MPTPYVRYAGPNIVSSPACVIRAGAFRFGPRAYGALRNLVRFAFIGANLVANSYRRAMANGSAASLSVDLYPAETTRLFALGSCNRIRSQAVYVMPVSLRKDRERFISTRAASECPETREILAASSFPYTSSGR